MKQKHNCQNYKQRTDVCIGWAITGRS